MLQRNTRRGHHCDAGTVVLRFALRMISDAA
jgi:hypothetical protein